MIEFKRTSRTNLRSFASESTANSSLLMVEMVEMNGENGGNDEPPFGPKIREQHPS